MKKCKHCGLEIIGRRPNAKFCTRKCTTKFHVSEARRKRKRKLVDYFGGKCIRCGYSKSIWALQFHHRDPTTKEYALGADGCTRSWERDLAEANKCDLICANCHAEEHEIK